MTYTVDTGSSNTSYTLIGLNPGKNYNITVAAKNSIGLGAASSTLAITTAAQQTSSSPSIVQSATFRSDNPSPASITLSLPNAPSAANSIFVFFNGYAGTGSNSNAITAPAGATVISQAAYDGGTEVQWCWEINSNVNANSFTFSNFDNTDNAGWKIVEVSNVASFDVNHGPVSTATTTSIGWPLVAPTATNCLRLTQLSVQFAVTPGAPSSGVSIVKADPITVTYHQGILLSESPGTTTASLAITGGVASDTDSYLSLNLYGTALPGQVTNLAFSNITSNSLKLSWTGVSNATAYTIMYEGGGVSTFTQLAVLPSTTTTYNVTNLIQSTTYVFYVFASNAAGQGPSSSTVSPSTTAVKTLAVVQSQVASSTSASSTLASLTVTFPSATTVGNTLFFFFSCLNSVNNAALTAPSNATNSTGILMDNGSSTDMLQIAWTQSVTAATTSYSFGQFNDAGCLFVVEVAGVTSIDAAMHGGNLSFTDGSGGHVILPVTAPANTPSFGLYAIHMDNTPDSWGTPPSGMTMLQKIVNGGTATYHQGALLKADSTVNGNETIPYSLATVTQLSPPTYIGFDIYGSASIPPPSAPTVTLTTTTSTTQAMTWTTPTTGTTTSYAVQYRVTTTTTWNTFVSGITTNGTTVTGLTAATSYDYQVIAYNGSQAGPSSVVVTKSTLSPTPSQVTGVLLGTSTTTTQPISWNAATSATSYVVQYKLATASTFTNSASITALNTTITGLTANSNYIYDVVAYNGLTAGTASNTVSGSTQSLPSPNQPTGVTLGLATDTTQPISWSSGGGTTTSYSVLYSSTSNTGPWTTVQGISSTSTTISGLSPATLYYYEVIAYNGSSPSAASTVASQSTGSAVAPGQVTGLAAGTSTSTSQPLTWNAATGTVTSYTVQYKVVGATSFTSVTGVTATSYVVTGLAPATTYVYQVFALNTTAAPGSVSAQVTASTLTAQGGSGSHLVTVNGKLLTVGGKFVIA